jgi:hypothetical protein
MSRPVPQPFPVLLQRFFVQRLVQQQHVTPCTVAAYRDSFRLLLAFAHERLQKSPSDIALEDLSASFILDFLNHLEVDRHNCITAVAAGTRASLPSAHSWNTSLSRSPRRWPWRNRFWRFR